MNRRILEFLKGRRYGQRGAGFAETGLVLPLLLLMVLGTVELGRIIRANQAAVLLSREAVTAVSRNCSKLATPGQAPELSACITAELALVKIHAQAILPQAEIVASVFKRLDCTGTIPDPCEPGEHTRLLGIGSTIPGNSGSTLTHLPPANTIFRQALTEYNRVIAIAEVIAVLPSIGPRSIRFGELSVYEAAEM